MTTDATSRACLRMAADLGRMRALDETGLLKTAGMLDRLLESSAGVWAPAGIGYVMGGPEHRLEGTLAGAFGGHLGRRFLRGLNMKELRKAVEIEPALSKYRALGDRDLLSRLRTSSAIQTSPELEHIKEFLPTLRRYEGLGSLAGGALAGYGTGQVLSSQDRPTRFVM